MTSSCYYAVCAKSAKGLTLRKWGASRQLSTKQTLFPFWFPSLTFSSCKLDTRAVRYLITLSLKVIQQINSYKMSKATTRMSNSYVFYSARFRSSTSHNESNVKSENGLSALNVLLHLAHDVDTSLKAYVIDRTLGKRESLKRRRGLTSS